MGDIVSVDSNLMSVVLPAVGIVIWLIRLEGRVNTTEQRFRDLKDDVTYIRSRIDRALTGMDED